MSAVKGYGDQGDEGMDMDFVAPVRDYPAPPNAVTRFFEPFFKVYERGSTYLGEFRAGCVLFMTSAYILFLNPLILSGGSSAFNTGMPATDVALATSISTGVGTVMMGLAGNYPWVISVQLGTNTYFVNSVLKIRAPCGYHAHLYATDTVNAPAACRGIPCQCDASGTPTVFLDTASPCFNQSSTLECLGTEIPFEKALAATVLEGIVFVAICLLGIREYILRLFPKGVLMSASAGIGVFISFVGLKDMGVITAAPFPTLLQLNQGIPYLPGGWGKPGYDSKVSFNSCRLYFDGPPFSVVCPWLSVGGLIFTGILLVWNVNGAFIMGIFFTMFISWMKFPGDLATGEGLVPKKVVDKPEFLVTAGALDFNWGNQTEDLIIAFITFLYLDFIGSSITFVALGRMMGIVDKKGRMPRSNQAFIADGSATLIGGLLGSSALTTYVESAAAVREGGRTGVTALVCAGWFFLTVFLAPLFSSIPFIATGPILVLIGVLIFMSSIMDIAWNDITEAIPAYATILGMPFTHNIAYGFIGGMFAYFIAKFVSYQLVPSIQQRWPGYQLFLRLTDPKKQNMFCRVPGWNTDVGPDGPKLPYEPIWIDMSVNTALKRYVLPRFGYVDPDYAAPPSKEGSRRNDAVPA